MTDRWMRSPNGEIFGVCTGLAEWRGLPPGPVRLICLLAVLFTGVFPGVLIYLALALILPSADGAHDGLGARLRQGKASATDARYTESERSTEDLKAEYEELKKKVEAMEDEMFDKERDWDERFSRS